MYKKRFFFTFQLISIDIFLLSYNIFDYFIVLNHFTAFLTPAKKGRNNNTHK